MCGHDDYEHCRNGMGCCCLHLLVWMSSFVVVVVVVCVRRCHLHKYLCTNKNIPEYVVLCSCAHLLVRFCGAVSSLLIIINRDQEVDAAKGGWGETWGSIFMLGGNMGGREQDGNWEKFVWVSYSWWWDSMAE